MERIRKGNRLHGRNERKARTGIRRQTSAQLDPGVLHPHATTASAARRVCSGRRSWSASCAGVAAVLFHDRLSRSSCTSPCGSESATCRQRAGPTNTFPPGWSIAGLDAAAAPGSRTVVTAAHSLGRRPAVRRPGLHRWPRRPRATAPTRSSPPTTTARARSATACRSSRPSPAPSPSARAARAAAEGPITQIGAGFGYFLASVFGFSNADRRVLLAAGMGAGIAAILRARWPAPCSPPRCSTGRPSSSRK